MSIWLRSRCFACRLKIYLGAKTNRRAIYELKQIDRGSQLYKQVVNNSKLYLLTTDSKLRIKVTVWRNESKRDCMRQRNEQLKQSCFLFSKRIENFEQTINFSKRVKKLFKGLLIEQTGF